MTAHHLAPFVALGSLALLTGCAAGPTSAPTTPDPTTPEQTAASTPTCDESVFSDNVDADLTAKATPLDELPFPLDGLADAGVGFVCTAHLAVDYAGAQTVEFDILVADASLDETEAALDDAVADQKWVRDDAAPIWRAPDDQNQYVEALEIDEGVLVGATQAG